jgi:O-antigen ligase
MPKFRKPQWGSGLPQPPSAFLSGGFVLTVMAVWIASSCSRYFGLPVFAGLPQITIARTCFVVLVMYACAMVGVRRPRLRSWVSLELILWLLAACAFVSGYAYGAFKADPVFREFVFNALLFPAVAVSLVLRSRITERDVARFAVLLTIFGVYLGTTAFLEHFSVTWALVPAAIADPSQGIHIGRSRGPWLQAAFNGTVLVMLVPVAMLLLRLPERRWRVLGGLTTCLLCGAAYLTYTRAALLALAALLLLGGIIASPSRRHYRVVWAGLALTLVVLVAGGAPVIPRMGEASPINDRFDLLIATGEMVLSHPLVGVGYGNFDLLQHQFFEGGKHFGSIAFNKEFWEGGSHNTLLTPFAEMGILVGLLNFGFLLSRIWIGLRTKIRPRAGETIRHPVLICSALLFVGFILNAVFVELRYTSTPTLLLWSFAALAERYRWVLGATPSDSSPPMPTLRKIEVSPVTVAAAGAA